MIRDILPMAVVVALLSGAGTAHAQSPASAPAQPPAQSPAQSPAPAWFQALDGDRSGAITLAEIHRARWGRFARFDADRDGFLVPAELRGSTTWLERFSWYDQDADGRISVAEFEAKGRQRFVMMDADADGRVTLEEIRSLSNASAPAASADTTG